MDTRLKENKRRLSTVTIHQEQQQSPTIKKAGSEYFPALPSIFSNNNNNSDNKSISSFKSVDIPSNYSSSTSTSTSLTLPSSSLTKTTTTTTTGVKGALSARNLSHSKNSSVETLSLTSDARRFFDEDDLDDDETFIIDYTQDE